VDQDDFQEADLDAICKPLCAEPSVPIGTIDTGSIKLNVAVRPYVVQEVSIVDPQDAEMSKQLQLMQKTSSSYSNNLVSTLRESSPGLKRTLESSLPVRKRAKVAVATKANLQVLKEQDTSVVLPLTLEDLGLTASQGLEPINLVTTTAVRLRSDKLAQLLVHCIALQNGKAESAGHVFDPDALAAGQVSRIIQSNRVNCTCGEDRVAAAMVSVSPFHESFCADLLTFVALLSCLRRLATCALLWL
jgi:hypothetical protein